MSAGRGGCLRDTLPGCSTCYKAQDGAATLLKHITEMSTQLHGHYVPSLYVSQYAVCEPEEEQHKQD